jgi:hypothetical protein
MSVSGKDIQTFKVSAKSTPASLGIMRILIRRFGRLPGHRPPVAALFD